jgi:hypothetical protein
VPEKLIHVGYPPNTQPNEKQHNTMINSLNKLTLAFLCAGAAGAALSATPVATPATPTVLRPAPDKVNLPPPYPPGNLTGVTVQGPVVAGTAATFTFTGVGSCKLEFNGGDNGATVKFEGKFPFTGNYTYGTGSMSSSETFKKYDFHAKPLGNCKTDYKGSKTEYVDPVTVNNPSPQGVAPTGANNPVTVSSTLTVGMKPGKMDNTPAVPASIASIAVIGKPAAGTPTALEVKGTGHCKYHLSYVNLDAEGKLIVKPYPMLTRSSSAQVPFPMSLKMLDATPAGIYKWTAAGIDGCTGNADVTFTVQ